MDSTTARTKSPNPESPDMAAPSIDSTRADGPRMEAPLSQIEQVRLALSARQMGPALQQALDRPDDGNVVAAGLRPAPTKPAPVCRVVYMKYEPGEYCILLYRLDEQMVVGHLRWEDSAPVPPASIHRIERLGMEVYLYPKDPWLPGLETAADPQVIAEALARGLPLCQTGAVRVLRVRVTPQRYRPGRRLTLRLDIHFRDRDRGETFARTYFAKVYHDPKKASSVYQEMQMLAQIPAAREGRVVLAGAAAYLHDLSMILQEPVGGTPLEDQISRLIESRTSAQDFRAELEMIRKSPALADSLPGWSGMQRAAEALAAVHTAGLETGRRRKIQDELARFRKRAAKIASVDAAQGARLDELAAALPAWLPWLDEWGAGLSLIHGDCKPSQFLISDDGRAGSPVAILDFDHAGMADPANDVGTYLATLRQLAVRQSLKARGAATRGDEASAARAEWLLALEKHFLNAYSTASGHGEGFRLRAVWYEAVGLLRKALRGFGRSPFSPLPGAMVEEAWRCLAELPSAGQRMGAKGDGK